MKFERIEKGFSQEGLGLMVRLPQAVISLVETRRLRPLDHQLTALAQVLDVHPPELLLVDIVVPSAPAPEHVEAPELATR
jgi:transcriptional regulator with XRE-family HTH domain